MEYKAIKYEKKGTIGIVTLNRPDSYNAVNSEMKDDLLHVFGKIHNDKSLRAIMLTGEGRGFSAGADLKSFTDAELSTPHDIENDLNLRWANITRRIMNLDKPVIAAVNGSVAGASLGFMLACDFIVMSDTASLRYPFINIALVPDAGSSWFLIQTVGYHKAMQIIAGGEKISAVDCKTLGIVHSVFSHDTFREDAMSFTEKIAEGPTAAIVSTKRLLRYAEFNGLNNTMEMEGTEQAKNIMGVDNVEGVQAFLDKRKPNFTGIGYTDK